MPPRTRKLPNRVAENLRLNGNRVTCCDFASRKRFTDGALIAIENGIAAEALKVALRTP